ncbi:hypothetical protein [Clostridium peptidivorans]|uniref:hypothetical protein n=1 Tax=Clostridium peptidivorans TaxID=100174 RepID=UPI000BE3F1BE|nr:hypothetical protein [Clostridium peptidivorans]
MDNEMTRCLTSLFNALTAKSEEESIEMFGEAISHAKESKVKINNPENFDCFINHKLKKGVKLLASTLHEPSVCKDKNKPNFIYANYGFLENHIKNLCVLREGSSCCADKSRYILKMYLEYSITGKIPSFNPNVEKYWIPNFGDNQMWVNYCDSLCRLYYGYTEEYFKAYNSLIQCEIRKFKHILHRWFVEYRNGEIIEFTTSWDERTENPLKTDMEGDYYIINKKYTGTVETEPYDATDEEFQFLYRHCVKVHKDKIARIYHTDEERMC